MAYLIEKKPAFVSIFAIFFSAIVISVLTAIYVLLIKQIEMMEIDSQSFQSLYTADSAFECMIYKEQTASGTASVFLPENTSNLGNCGSVVDGLVDLDWVVSKSPIRVASTTSISVRSVSTANLKLKVSDSYYCAIISTDVETADYSQQTTSPMSNFMTIAGHNKSCGSPSQKVVERVIDFYF